MEKFKIVDYHYLETYHFHCVSEANAWAWAHALSMVTWFNQQIVTDLLLFTSNIALFSHRHDVTQSYDDFLGSFTGKNGRKINQNRTFGSFSRYEKGEKWPKMGQFWGRKFGREIKSWPKKSSPQKFKSSQKWINSSPIGEIFGVQSGPILALWWPERATAEVENAKIFGLRGALPP